MAPISILILGLSAVTLSHLILFTIERSDLRQSCPRIQPPKSDVQSGWVRNLFSYGVMFSYLIAMWTGGWNQASYYKSSSLSVSLLHLFEQLLVVDFTFYWVHRYLHSSRKLFYYLGHFYHHRISSPTLSSAFVGSFRDILALTIFPLYLTAIIVPADALSYILFGVLWSIRLAMIHSAFVYPFDRLLEKVGIVTGSHHHSHHLRPNRNFGNIFNFWDHLFGTSDSINLKS